MTDLTTTKEIYTVLSENGVADFKIKQCLQLLEEKGFLEGMSSFCAVKKGMTNRLFYFKTREKEYLVRIPGEGSEYLLDRVQESSVYRKLEGMNITDKYVYINPSTGIKITEYIADAHTCDAGNMDEVRSCVRHLRALHDLAIVSEKKFDVFETLALYEKSCKHDISAFVPEYDIRRGEVLELKKFIDETAKREVLCHVDPVYDNFLIKNDNVFLIDWEYTAQADPDMDIAMFCIYAGYGKEEIDTVIRFYYPDGCDKRTKIKIYSYVACCALLWVVWCEIKRDSGVLFEPYEKQQYDYIHEFYELVLAELRSAGAAEAKE